MRDALMLAKIPFPITDLCRVFAKALRVGWPAAIPICIFLFGNQVHRALTGLSLTSAKEVFKHFANEGSARFALFYSKLSGREDLPSTSHVCSAEEEFRFWKASSRYNKVLQSSNANATPPNLPLVRYYVPRMLPVYRLARETDAETTEYHLPAKMFCKWHRMVFRGPLHPTLGQAEKLIANYSSRDRQEMHRISRLLTDKEVFSQTVPWTPLYRNMWIDWLATKGPDVAIVFVRDP